MLFTQTQSDSSVELPRAHLGLPLVHRAILRVISCQLTLFAGGAQSPFGQDGASMQECLMRIEQSTALPPGQSFAVYDVEEVREDVTTLYVKCLAALSEG